jgi:hypothetical protein
MSTPQSVWSSLSAIARAFNLPQESSPEQLRAELLEKRKLVHPNRFALDAYPEDANLEYRRIDSALSYIDRARADDNALVPVRLTDIVALATRTLAQSSRTPGVPTAEERAAATESAQLSALHTAYKVPQRAAIGASAVWGVLGGILFVLPASAAANPFIARLVTNQAAFLAWLVALGLGFAVVVILYLRERKLAVSTTRLFSFTLERQVLEELVLDAQDEDRFAGGSGPVFQRSSLQTLLAKRAGAPPWQSNTVRNMIRRLSRLAGLHPQPPWEAVEVAADICIQRFLERKRIGRVDPDRLRTARITSFDDWYEILGE